MRRIGFFSHHILTFAHLKILFDSFLHIGQSHYFLLFRRLWSVPDGLELWYHDLQKLTNFPLTCAGSFSKEQVCCLRTTLLGRTPLQLVLTLLFCRLLLLSLYRPESIVTFNVLDKIFLVACATLLRILHLCLHEYKTQRYWRYGIFYS